MIGFSYFKNETNNSVMCFDDEVHYSASGIISLGQALAFRATNLTVFSEAQLCKTDQAFRRGKAV